MKRIMVCSAFCISLLYLCSAGSAQKKGEKIPFSDENVEKSLKKAVDYLWSRQKPDGSWETFFLAMDRDLPKEKQRIFDVGPTAQIIYALLENGEDVKDDRIKKALDWMAKQKAPTIYDLAFRVSAFSKAVKLDPKNRDYSKLMQQDIATIINARLPGNRYSYWADTKINSGGDNSNAQYALYAVWCGARANLEMPREYWEATLKYWLTQQENDGGWGYFKGGGIRPEPYIAMTTAGLASLYVCIDQIFGEKFIKCNTANEFAPIKKGLDWMDKNFQTALKQRNVTGIINYTWYGVERVGLASGYKYFGALDWYKTGATQLINLQRPDGSWPTDGVFDGNESSSTAYAILFLVRGRRPVLLNRLEYDGDWNNRPRALANLCRWAENAYEHEVNWQIITLKSNVDEWHDAPVVIITGSTAPKFSDEDMVKLRTYVEQGGTLLSITECGGARAFGVGIRNLYKKLFPKYELAGIGRDNPIYTVHYKMPGTPPMAIVSNGVRPLAIHIDADLPLAWQTYQVATAKANFEAAANILTYVTDRELYNRGSNVWPEAASAPKKLKAARLRYAGNYDPEPLALQRLSRLMAKNNNVEIDYTSALASTAPAAQASIPATGIEPSQLTSDIKLAFLTGTGAFKLSDADKDALKKWIDAGGLLLIDATGGAKPFADSARELVAGMYGPDVLLPLPLSSPVYQVKDMTVNKVKYRKTTKVRIGIMTDPRLLAVLAGDRPKIILSVEDLTAGMVGYDSWGVDGYVPQSALDIVRNIVLYAATITK